MFEKYFEMCEKVRMQLLEGAITYEEYFNKVVFEAVELTNTREYEEHLANRKLEEAQLIEE